MDLLAYAKKIAGKIEAQSARAGVPVAVSIIDVHGNIILKHRMNSAPVFAADLSERKAYTSALVGLRTADLDPLVQPGQSLYALMGVSGGRYCSMGGGAPLTFEGQRVAGVGVSGGTVEQDIDILESALREAEATDATEMKLEVVVLPVADVDRAKRFYGDLGWRTGHRLRIGRRLPGNPVHAARLGLLDHLRKERHDGCTGLGEGSAPDRVRHRGRPSRTSKPRGRNQ